MNIYDEDSFWTDIEWLEGGQWGRDEIIDWLKSTIKKSGGKIKKNKEFMAEYTARKV